MRWLRDILVDGLLLAVPLIALGYLLAHAVKSIGHLLAPLAKLAPGDRWLGVATIDLLAIGALLVILILVGAFARSAWGQRFATAIEKVVLRKIPGFLLFKAMATGFSSTDSDQGFDPALIWFDDHAELGFVIEDDGSAEQIVVFLPSAPTPAAGNVVVVPRERVQRLAITASEAIGTVTRLGLGLQGVLNKSYQDRRSQA